MNRLKFYQINIDILLYRYINLSSTLCFPLIQNAGGTLLIKILEFRGCAIIIKNWLGSKNVLNNYYQG